MMASARIRKKRRWPLFLALLVCLAAIAIAVGTIVRDDGGSRGSSESTPDSDAVDEIQSVYEPPGAPSCGDGRLDPGEDCDPPGETMSCGALLPNASNDVVDCSSDCLWEIEACRPNDGICGDGFVQAGELCDDGNTRGGDGCDSSCLVEVAGTSVHYDGPATDARVERALGNSACRSSVTRQDARRGPRRRVEYRLLICEMPGGEEVYPVERVRATLAEVRRALRPAGIDLVEDGLERLRFGTSCRVPYGAPALREWAAETWAERKLPLFFVGSIEGGPIPGKGTRGFAAFGYGAVLASTQPDVVIHELGHVFGLLHTHACIGASGGVNLSCDRWGDGICDTPFDPGPAWLPHTCGGRAAEVCPLACGLDACSGGAEPDRSNHMSYFSGCRTHFSNDQLDMMRCVLDHELAWLTAADNCASEVCNGADDDCDGQIDEGRVCESVCVRTERLRVGSNVGTTVGRGEAYGGQLYAEGTPDALFELRPDRAGQYCISIGGGAGGGALGPIVVQRESCEWDAGAIASNLDVERARLRPTLEVSAGPQMPAWISVDGWGRSNGIAYSLEITRGPCDAAVRLQAPRLVEPASGARVREDPIQLRWDVVPGAEAYELRLGAERAGLTDDIPCEGCDAQIVYAPSVALRGVATGRRVYWSVRALRGDDESAFARPRTFEVGSRPGETPLRTPRLLTPESGAVLETLTETFEWEPVEGALFYEFRLGLDPGSLTAEACEQCLASSVFETAFEPTPRVMGIGNEYFWTVRASREAEQSSFASARRFEIEDWICTRVGRVDVPGERTAHVLADEYDDFSATCGGDSSAEQVWLVVPVESGTLCIDTGVADFDTVLSVRLRCEQPETEIACSDDGFGEQGGGSRVEIDVIAEQPLFIIVDGYDIADGGAYSLRVREGACQR